MVARNPVNEDPTSAATSAAYVVCPRCEHPAILRRTIPGQPFRCRQCNSKFLIQGMRKSPQANASARRERAEPSEQ